MPLIRDTKSEEKKEEKKEETATDRVVAASKDSKTGQGSTPTKADIASAAKDLNAQENAKAPAKK